MTPTRPDVVVVGRRLRMISDALGDLERLRDVSADQLVADPIVRAAAERLLQVVVDLAVDINSHLVVAMTGSAPRTGRASFLEAGASGVISPTLADRLAPAAGLRNVLVHRYTDIRIDLVASAVREVLEAFPAYVQEVARFLETRGGEDS